jgi:hypothetical protein
VLAANHPAGDQAEENAGDTNHEGFRLHLEF